MHRHQATGTPSHTDDTAASTNFPYRDAKLQASEKCELAHALAGIVKIDFRVHVALCVSVQGKDASQIGNSSAHWEK